MSGNCGNFCRECIIRGSSEIIITEDGEAVLYKDFGNCDNSKFMTSNIYAARIMEYAPHLHAFFVDIGCGDRCHRAILSESDLSGAISTAGARGTAPGIGDFCLVQIISAPRDKKGARVSAKIRITGSKVVLLPCENEAAANISGKIRNSASRERLLMLGESIFEDNSREHFSLIFRTECDCASSTEILADYDGLCVLWNELLEKFSCFVKNGKVGNIYTINPFFAELLKYPISSYSKICADSLDILEQIKSDLPMVSSIVQYIPNRIFESKSVDDIPLSLRGRKIFLKSGANIVIEKTEALTVIDINSAKSNLSYHEVNLEAASEIMRQLRLRDIGGIIICDFIEPDNKKDRFALVDLMRELAFIDPSKPDIAGITQLGLIEISRRRR